MTQDDLKRIQEYRGYPALSLRVRTHRRMPEAQQDPTRVKNLIRHAEKVMLERDISGAVVHDYIHRLDRFHKQLDWRYLDEGLCVFVAAGRLAWVMLPEPVEETVVVGETFLTRDLVRITTRTPRYHLLVLSEQATRWYQGWGRRLSEESGHGFPIENQEDSHDPPEGFNRGVDPKSFANERSKVFLRRVAEAAKVRIKHEPAPVFVAGVDRLQALYREAAGEDAISGSVSGSFDGRSPHELAEALSPELERWQQERRHMVLQRFHEVKGTRNGVAGLREVGEAAAMARVDTLLVESPYSIAGNYDRETGRVITVANGGESDMAPDDVVDEIVETVMERGGNVVFYQDGRLAGASIGAILRY
jgi:hypothetical protein